MVTWGKKRGNGTKIQWIHGSEIKHLAVMDHEISGMKKRNFSSNNIQWHIHVKYSKDIKYDDSLHNGFV